MSKVALLIGVSQCQSSLNPLRWVSGVAEMARVLKSTAGFETVEYLQDHRLTETLAAIEHCLRDLQPTDQVLVLYAGYGIQSSGDSDDPLYLATADTAADPTGKLLTHTALPTSFLRSRLDSCAAQQQVVILDCCFREALSNEPVLLGDWIDPWGQLGGKHRVVLSAANPSQSLDSPGQPGTDLGGWSYTQYLAEGIETGAADPDSNGTLTAADLHAYAVRKLAIAAPTLDLEIQGQDADQVFLEVPIQSTADRYRRVLEQQLQQGVPVDQTGLTLLGDRAVLREAQQTLGISPTTAVELESQTLRPVWEYRQRLRYYRQQCEELAAADLLTGDAFSQKLRKIQESLSLGEADVVEQVGTATVMPVLATDSDLTLAPEGSNVDEALPWYERPMVAGSSALGVTGLAATGLAAASLPGDRPSSSVPATDGINLLDWEADTADDFSPVTENSLRYPDEPVFGEFAAADLTNTTGLKASEWDPSPPESVAWSGDVIDPDAWKDGVDSTAEFMFNPRDEHLIDLPNGETDELLEQPPRDPNRDANLLTVALDSHDSAHDSQVATDMLTPPSSNDRPTSTTPERPASTNELPAHTAPTQLDEPPVVVATGSGDGDRRPQEPVRVGRFPIVPLVIGGLALMAGVVGARLAGWGNGPNLFAAGGQPGGGTTVAQKFNNWGLIKARQGEHQQAITEYDKALEADPNNALAHVNRGVAHTKLGNDDAALRDYDRAIELNPKLAYALSNRSHLHYKRRDFKKALEDGNVAVTYGPRLPEAHINLANARFATGDLDGAIKTYNQAIELNPPKNVQAGIFNNRGNVFLAQQNATAAVQNYNRALQLQPDLPDSFFNRALAFQFANNNAQAIEDFRTAARLYQDQGKADLGKDAFRRVNELQQPK